MCYNDWELKYTFALHVTFNTHLYQVTNSENLKIYTSRLA